MSAKVTAKAVSQVSEQLPSFIGEDFPLYEKFVKNYFEFLETIVVRYGIVTGYETAYTFTVGETVTGQTSGATATVKGTGANSGLNKLFLEPTNTLDFSINEIFIGSTSGAYGSVTSVTRNPVNALKLFTSLIDPSQTSEGVLEFFKKEFYPNIRKSSVTDLRKFIQHLKDFYRSKGSENSFRTLFRILYGQENVDFYFPKTDLLKVSDGKWSQDVVVQLIYDATYFSFNGLTITGVSSGSTAFVSNITDRKLGTIPIIELVLTNVSGTFTLGETITATTVTGTVISAIITGQLTDITINDGGAGYNINDEITIADSTLQGFGATATVANTTNDQVTILSSSNDGNGYQINDTFTFDNTGTNVDVTAEAKVTEIRDTYDLDVITTQLLSAVETISFNVVGASVGLPFNVAVQSGFLVANNPDFASATKAAEIISITNSEITVYDRANEAPTSVNSDILLEDGNQILFENGDALVQEEASISGQTTAIPKTYLALADDDSLYLFDKNENAIAGALSVRIEDTSFTTVTSNISLNATNYGASFNSTSISSTIQSAMTFETKTFGRINKVSITSHGSGYESAPTVSITNDHYEDIFEPDNTEDPDTGTSAGGLKGKNAVFTIGTLGGEITDITISEKGFGYIADPTTTASTNASSSGSVSASLSPVLTATKTKDGVFTDDSGKPSSQKKIQDNDYYQDFSYVIQTADSIDIWRQDTLKLLHPAGLKLFGEVAIATLLNSTMFDRGFNNINSILDNGLSQYRELSLELISEILNSTDVSAEIELVKEVQFDNFIDNSIYYGNSGDDPFLYYEDGAIIIMEDGDNLLTENATRITNSQFTSIASAIIEYLQLMLSTTGSPAEFFSLLSVKDISAINFGVIVNDPLLLENGDNILAENGDTIVREDVETITIQTSEPHYFHENDEIYLDNFVGDVLVLNSTDGTSNDGSKILFEDGRGIEVENSNVDLLNGKLFRARRVDVVNNGSVVTLGDPISLTDYGTIDIIDDEVPTTSDSISISTNGKIYRPSKTASSGVPISLMTNEYIGEYSNYVVDNYEYFSPSDFTSVDVDTRMIFKERRLSIESNILLEDGDELLLEDSLPPSHASYSGTSSNLGKLLIDDGVIDHDSGDTDELILTDTQTKVVLGSFLLDEDSIGDDKLILEDSLSNGGILAEDTGVVNGVVTFDQPFDYKLQPYQNNNGFGYFKHRVDQRVSV